MEKKEDNIKGKQIQVSNDKEQKVLKMEDLWTLQHLVDFHTGKIEVKKNKNSNEGEKKF